MTIAILGWGSLVWETDTPKAKKFYKYTGESWRVADLLELPLEFSRISASRKSALTLVIDKRNGTNCTIRYIQSRRTQLNDVICDLRCREATVWRHIGYWSNDGQSSDHLFSYRISQWANRADYAAVVWTALPSNFLELKGEDFTVDRAIAHLKSLSPEGQIEAKTYLDNAPQGIRTNLLQEVSVESPFS